MSTMRDYLEHYNNLDVLPMVEGVEKFKNYFAERGVDVFQRFHLRPCIVWLISLCNFE